MFNKRIISSAVGIALLVLAIFSGSLIFGIGIFVVTFIALTEFYRCVENQGHRPIKFLGYIFSLFMIVLGYNINIAKMGVLDFSYMIDAYLFIILILIMAIFSIPVFTKMKFKYTDIALTLMSVIYIVVPFSFIITTYNLKDGKLLVLLIFAGGWISDTFAYLVGKFLGKTKLLPEISPKKTLEGAIGGFLGDVLIFTVLGFIFYAAGIKISLFHYTVMGMLSGVLSQIGDWTASVIKRQCHIKDFGRIMPGHGGVLDRFDSILFVAPVIYFYLKVFLRV